MITAKSAKKRANKATATAPIFTLTELSEAISSHADLGFENLFVDVPNSKVSKFQEKLEENGYQVWQTGPTGGGFIGLEIYWDSSNA